MAARAFLLLDMSWQEGQVVGWQEGHRVTPDLSEGLWCEGWGGKGGDDMCLALPSPAPAL